MTTPPFQQAYLTVLTNLSPYDDVGDDTLQQVSSTQILFTLLSGLALLAKDSAAARGCFGNHTDASVALSVDAGISGSSRDRVSHNPPRAGCGGGEEGQNEGGKKNSKSQHHRFPQHSARSSVCVCVLSVCLVCA